ncbi:MAG: symmetrical bis(5'-nucleosyl)-tetraphosphatase [Gammaproteobacteria bacterium]|nr:symmetrical bis(5'-nucleosyl)-tetraphosphatase [Gammaproteobacteria bacterium]
MGDIQGCNLELQALLEKMRFRPSYDTLWFTGDLVNRGPSSLAVLRFVHSLGERAITVLGNHDLHLLARRFVADRRPKSGDTLEAILAAPDCDELLTWLRRRPVLHYDGYLGYGMVHAGLAPQWTFEEARGYANELETALRSTEFRTFLVAMYGSLPARWDPTLQGIDRLRFFTNCFTRMRYCSADGTLDLKAKGPLGSQSFAGLPWFMQPLRRSLDTRILFGHWSTLRLTIAQSETFNAFPLDTGAVWGDSLTALRLDDGIRFYVPATTREHPLAEE